MSTKMSIISGIAAVRGLCISHLPPLCAKTSFLPFLSGMHRLAYLHGDFGAPNWLCERIEAHFFSVAQSHRVSSVALDFKSSVAQRANLLSFSFLQPFARSRILTVAHSGGQHGGTSRFHSPRGCAKRRLSRRPWRNSQYSPESRWRYVFLLDLIREISVTSERKREKA